MTFNETLLDAADALARWNRVYRAPGPAETEYRNFDQRPVTWTFSECCAAAVGKRLRVGTTTAHKWNRDECEQVFALARHLLERAEADDAAV